MHCPNVAPVTGRGTFTVEWSVPGTAEADRALAAASVDEVADQLLAQHPVSA
jgi:hypothetical protein